MEDNGSAIFLDSFDLVIISARSSVPSVEAIKTQRRDHERAMLGEARARVLRVPPYVFSAVM